MTVVEQVVSLRRTLNRLITRHVAQQTERSFLELIALRTVERGDQPTQAAVADCLGIDQPAASRMVARLEADGLLTRRPGKDRRCLELQVTARARPELDALARSIEWLDAQVHEHLSEEEAAQAVRLLGKLQAGLGTASADRALKGG